MITYRNATNDDLNEIAKLHKLCFKEYFLTSLGVNLLGKYYKEYLNEGAPFVLAENDENEIIGFCMGYQDATTQAHKNFQSNNKIRLATRLFFLCCAFNKNAWIRVIAKIKSIFRRAKHRKDPVKKNNKSNTVGSLLSICLDSKYRGTDIAKTLVIKFEDELKAMGIEEYTLSVYSTNARARAFYEKTGFSFHCEEGDSIIYIKTLQE